MKLPVAILLSTISLLGYSQKTDYTFSSPGDTTRNYYVTVYPKEKINGLIVLLPGFGELPRQTLLESDIQRHASVAGYLTIIPALGDWSFFYIDETSHKKLEQLLEEVIKKHDLHDKPFIIGGHSFGGTMALQYAQRANADQSILKKPDAVFAIDPPLDLERLYTCMTTTNRPPKNPVSVQEDNYVSKRIQQEFKTDPTSNPQFFWNISPYAQSDGEHTLLKKLVSVPIRIYNEPDIQWYLENRNIDYYCINALDSAAMINWLRSFGNKKATLITTSGKGYRITSNKRHPHSWSIVNGEELVTWITENSKRN